MEKRGPRGGSASPSISVMNGLPVDLEGRYSNVCGSVSTQHKESMLTKDGEPGGTFITKPKLQALERVCAHTLVCVYACVLVCVDVCVCVCVGGMLGVKC